MYVYTMNNNDAAITALAAKLSAAVQTEWAQPLAEDDVYRVVLVAKGLEELYYGSRYCLQTKTVEGAWRTIGFTPSAVEAAAFVIV